MSAETLIIGATGFIGKHLLEHLLQSGESIRVLARTPEKIKIRNENLEVLKGDLENPESLAPAMEGIKTIYYLAHGMETSEKHFLNKELLQANNLAGYLTENHRLIYLGGIIPDGSLSEHLESRMKVGEVFAKTSAQIIEFRASIVVGDGSASYDMVRALVRRLPFILKTNWSEALCQPIALKNVIEYLDQASRVELSDNNTIINIGGKSKLPYRELMTRYAQSEGLIRPLVKIKVFPKVLAQELLCIVAPEFYQVGAKLLESIEHETIVKDNIAKDNFNVDLLNIDEMIDEVAPLNIEKLDQKELLKRIKSSEKLSMLMEGQVLTLTIPVPDLAILQKIQEAIRSVLPLFGFFKKNLHFNIPLVGEINSTINDDYLIMTYKPLYFFQELSWVFWDKIMHQIKSVLSKEN